MTREDLNEIYEGYIRKLTLGCSYEEMASFMELHFHSLIEMCYDSLKKEKQ